MPKGGHFAAMEQPGLLAQENSSVHRARGFAAPGLHRQTGVVILSRQVVMDDQVGNSEVMAEVALGPGKRANRRSAH